MNTKYNTGQAILIPATIRSAKEVNGKVLYDVDVESWDIPEDTIIVDERAERQKANQTFLAFYRSTIRDFR